MYQENYSAFKVFLNNTMVKLNFNVKDFKDLLENKNSSVVFLEYNRFNGETIVNSKVIAKRLRDFKDLDRNTLNLIYRDFLKHLTSKKVG